MDIDPLLHTQTPISSSHPKPNFGSINNETVFFNLDVVFINKILNIDLDPLTRRRALSAIAAETNKSIFEHRTKKWVKMKGGISLSWL